MHNTRLGLGVHYVQIFAQLVGEEKVAKISGDILKIGRQESQGHASQNSAMPQSKIH